MRVAIVSTMLALCAAIVPVSAQAVQQSYQLNIPREPLDGALKDLAQQTGLQIARFSDTQGGSALVGPVSGDMSVGQALTSLLGTSGLTWRVVNDHTYAIVSQSTGTSESQATNPAPAGVTPHAGDESSKEAGKKSSQDFRVAQVDQTSSGPQVSEEKKEEKKSTVQEVIVTGSRIPTAAKETAQEVKVYGKQQIDQSGQTTVADFLNTLPDASVSIGENGYQTGNGATTIQLHGLPVGTTLVLINGRRVPVSPGQESGGYGDFFDLNNIPVAAIDRIEVLPEGASAVYGSDAIAGVVNIILKKDLEGIAANAKYGSARGMGEWNTDLALGTDSERGAISIIGNFQARGSLSGGDRAITADQDYTRFGGPDSRSYNCNPGNVYSLDGNNLPGLNSPYAAVPVGFTGTPSIAEFAGTAGTLNRCNFAAGSDFIPQTRREGILVQGHYSVTSALEVFTELMYSHVQQFAVYGPPNLFGQPGYQAFAVGASNPFNPFGEPVGVSYEFTDLSPGIVEAYGSVFFRPLVGIRGSISGDWTWEISTWESQDWEKASETLSGRRNSVLQAALDSSDPATALNLFTAGPPGSTQLQNSLYYPAWMWSYYGRTVAASGFARGTLFRVPSGRVEMVFGSEYDRDTLSANIINEQPFFSPNTYSSFTRSSYAVYGEVRIPLIAGKQRPEDAPILTATLAGRYDHYSDFGAETTPQYGVEFRPISSLLVRGNFTKAFKAPTLFELYAPQYFGVGEFVSDPMRNGQVEGATIVTGGNPALRPETGQSRSVGVVYSSQALPGLRVALTSWDIHLDGSLQTLPAQTIVDNENLFPGDVIRASTCAGGPPCPITEVNAVSVNFGATRVAGFSYQLSYTMQTVLGQLSPSLSTTDTYRYSAALLPGVAPVDRVSIANDDGNWAPRWKGTLALGWTRGPYAAQLAGRYVGKYQDYDSTREIGNFWLCDVNFRYAIGDALHLTEPSLRNVYAEIGGVNVFNTLPQYSNYLGSFVGYDPTQADLRGRYLYARTGVRW